MEGGREGGREGRWEGLNDGGGREGTCMAILPEIDLVRCNICPNLHQQQSLSVSL